MNEPIRLVNDKAQRVWFITDTHIFLCALIYTIWTKLI